MSRKPRGDSILKTLPQERQDAIAEHIAQHNYRQTRAWLFADGIETSLAALSNFNSWYHLNKKFETLNRDTLDVIEMLRKRNPDMPEGELNEFANQYFQLQAIKSEDPETYLALTTARHKAKMDHAKLEQKERALKLAEEKFEHLRNQMSQAKAALEDVKTRGGLTPETLQRIEEASRLL